MITAPNLSLLFIMVCFWLVFLLVYTQLLKPLGSLLDQRGKTIQTARAGFESAQEELKAAIARCERDVVGAAGEAQKERAATRAAGEAARRARLDEAKTVGQERLARATAQLHEATEQARALLRERAGELARTLAERLLERRVAS